MNSVRLEYETEQIAVVTLNRPEAANAFSLELLEDLNDALDQIEKNRQLRVIVITGSGEKAFCAGADLKEREHMNDEEVIETVRKINQTITRVEDLETPSIAAVNGAAFGGGLELALGCDIRIGSERAKVGLTETSLGIIPGGGGTQRLSRLIGLGKAKYFILTAKRLSSQEALDVGLFEEVVSADLLMKKALEIAAVIAKNGPIGVKQAKKAIQLGFQTDLKTGLKIEQECYAKTIPTEDRLEGIRAFKEKRKPQYKGI